MSEESKTKEEQQEQQLPHILRQHPNAPSQDQIDQWKALHGDVMVSGFSETELYVWRPLTRPEYVHIQDMAQNPESGMNQYKLEELICDTCVLWKSTDRSWSEGKAGTPQTLSEQIMQNSNFLSPAAASMLVAKL